MRCVVTKDTLMVLFGFVITVAVVVFVAHSMMSGDDNSTSIAFNRALQEQQDVDASEQDQEVTIKNQADDSSSENEEDEAEVDVEETASGTDDDEIKSVVEADALIEKLTVDGFAQADTHEQAQELLGALNVKFEHFSDEFAGCAAAASALALADDNLNIQASAREYLSMEESAETLAGANSLFVWAQRDLAAAQGAWQQCTG